MTKKLSKEKQKVWDRLKNGVSSSASMTFIANGDLIVNGPYQVKPDIGSMYISSNAKMMIFDGTEWKVLA